MRRKVRVTFLFVCTPIFLFVSFSLYLSRDVFPVKEIFNPSSPTTILKTRSSTDYYNNNLHHPNLAIGKDDDDDRHLLRGPQAVTSFPDLIKTESILFPDWEVLLVISTKSLLSSDSDQKHSCLFQNNSTSLAIFSGNLPFSNQTTFKCILPNSVRRFLPYLHPILTKSPETYREIASESTEMFRWRFLAYESISTENDVILFVKGVNNRQGINRSPADLRCIFILNGVNNSVRTAVTSSDQEVFRCLKPNVTEFGNDEKIKVSLEIGDQEKKVVPSLAYYTPPPGNVASNEKKSLLCACTMVFNVAKFLKEWIVYHSKIGVEKFILYDNGSDDYLEEVISKLLEEKYNVQKILWPWPKTQEAGFSHCATYAKDSCTWMMYIDVDEFIYSPSWLHSPPSPPNPTLRSFLPRSYHTNSSSSELEAQISNGRSLLMRRSSSSHHLHHEQVGQISIKCLEFGPSNQRSHPMKGLIEGYTCRRRREARHKSIVLLDAIDTSLVNVIHHFELKEGYKMKKLSLEEGIVNHYKYQAWSEFKLKFRRRVSAYVVDWREGVNPTSKDRTPGLGFEPVEPKGWGNRFCEVHDNRLKLVTGKWFGSGSGSLSKYKMAWQDE